MKLLNSASKRLENPRSHKGSIGSNFNENNSEDNQNHNVSLNNHNGTGRYNNTLVDL